MSLSRDQLYQHLLNALQTVKSHMVVGSSNKVKDLAESGYWSFEYSTRIKEGKYEFFLDVAGKKKWRYQSTSGKSFYPALVQGQRPEEKSSSLSPAIINVLLIAAAGETTRSGNCLILVSVLACRLWRNKIPMDRIEVVEMVDYDHMFLIVNREGDLNSPAEWGERAFVVDPWYGDNGLIYSAAEFPATIQTVIEFSETESKELQQYNIDFDPIVGANASHKLKPYVDIQPSRDQLPADFRVDVSVSDEFAAVSPLQKTKYEACLKKISGEDNSRRFFFGRKKPLDLKSDFNLINKNRIALSDQKVKPSSFLCGLSRGLRAK